MDKYRELADAIKALTGHKDTAIYQGIVKELEGILCTVQIGSIEVPGVRLRASESEDEDSQMLMIPAIGSAVIVGSFSGDLTDMVVLAVDKVKEIIINGGKKGGLINVMDLVKKMNTLERDINNLKSLLLQWSPTPQDGGAALKAVTASWASSQLAITSRKDIEDDLIKH